MAKLTSRLFFCLSLALPLVVAAVGYIVPSLEGLLFLFGFAVVPYVLVSVCLVILIVRASTLRRLFWVSLLAPPLFGVALAVFVMTVGSVPAIHLTVREMCSQALGVAFGGSLYSIPYVLVAWGLWAVARRLKWVRNEFAT